MSGRHPFEVVFLAASALVGLVLLVVDARPRSVTTAMPAVVQVGWDVGLIVAGVVGLVGVTWTGRLSTALAVELLGMFALGTSTTMYSIVLFAVSGWAALAAGTFITAIAVASWWRAGQIWADLRRIGRAAQAGAVADVPLLMERADE